MPFGCSVSVGEEEEDGELMVVLLDGLDVLGLEEDLLEEVETRELMLIEIASPVGPGLFVEVGEW